MRVGQRYKLRIEVTTQKAIWTSGDSLTGYTNSDCRFTRITA